MQQPLAIGIDLGGTQLRAALVDRNGGIVSRAAVATDVAGGPAACRRADQAIVRGDRCRRTPGRDRRRRRVGARAARQRNGTIIAIPTLPGWEEFPLARGTAREFGLPVVARE